MSVKGRLKRWLDAIGEGATIVDPVATFGMTDTELAAWLLTRSARRGLCLANGDTLMLFVKADSPSTGTIEALTASEIKRRNKRARYALINPTERSLKRRIAAALALLEGAE